MGTIGGIVKEKSQLKMDDIIKFRLSIEQRGGDTQCEWIGANVALFQSTWEFSQKSLKKGQPVTHNLPGLVVVADARIDNSRELSEQLRGGSCADNLSGNELILLAYQKWGEDCPNHLLGDFSFVVWDQKEKRLFCARDPMAVRPFYYFEVEGGGLIFGTDIDLVIAGLAQVPPVVAKRLMELILLSRYNPEKTIYKGLRRLPKGSALVYAKGALRMFQYHRFEPHRRIRYRDEAQYAEHFFDIFKEAVSCRLDCVGTVGSTLSGGLDSSSIVCMARELLSEKRGLHTFSAIFPGLSKEQLQICDERQYMDAVLCQGVVVPHFIEATQQSPSEFLQRYARAPEPIWGYNMYIHEAMYKRAVELGVKVFLDGFDGDTTVSHGYGLLYRYGQTLRLIALLRESQAVAGRQGNRISVRGVIKKFILAQYFPILFAPSKQNYLGSELKDLLTKDWAGLTLRNHDVEKEGWRKAPNIEHCDSLNSHQFSLGHEIIDIVLGAMPLECRYPFWDRRLMEFCLAIPTEQKLKNGANRYVMRQAMKALLPEMVYERTSKANLSPWFREDVLGRGKEFIHESLRSVEAFQDIFDQAKVLKYMENGPVDGDAEKFSTSLFRIAALAGWLKHRSHSIDYV